MISLLLDQENNLTSYDELEKQTASVTNKRNGYSKEIRKLEAQMSDNAKLQKQIVNYSKTRKVYEGYRKAGYSKKYLTLYESEILLHKAAKAEFDKLVKTDDKKLPSVSSLRTKYADLLEQKHKLYAEIKSDKRDAQNLLTAKANVDLILGKSSVIDKLKASKSENKDTQAIPEKTINNDKNAKSQF